MAHFPEMDEERYIKGPRVNRKALKRKAEAKQKRLDKERMRVDRDPSHRLGKNEKKFIARRNIILEETETVEKPVTEEPRKAAKFGRPKRKVSRHLDKTTDHLEDDTDDDPHWWGDYMAKLSNKAHKSRRIHEQQRKDYIAWLDREEKIRNCYEYIRCLYELEGSFHLGILKYPRTLYKPIYDD